MSTDNRLAPGSFDPSVATNYGTRAKDAPMVETEMVPNCAVCGVFDFEDYAAGFDYESLTCRNQWRFVRCRRCGHVWLNPRPTAAMLSVVYPPTYYAYNFESQVNVVARRGKAWIDGRKMNGILARLTTAPRTYLDVGCGDGRFLRDMERRGLTRGSLYGLELDARVAGALAADGYQVSCDRVETCNTVPLAGVDLATMFHVIEHVSDPGAVLSRLADWLAPAGVLALETPNLDSLDARLFRGTYWGGYHFPRHWHLFTPATLIRLLERCGFDVESVGYQTGHSFWMYSVHHALKYSRRSKVQWMARWFDPLKGLPMLMGFTGWDMVRHRMGLKTSAMLLVARKRR